MEFNYNWKLSDGYPKHRNNLKVFSTFSGGGGSSMGYKLAGLDVVAANDIDEKMKRVYLANNKVENFYLMPIKNLLNKNDLPNIDILDGSPPCSTFSMAGKREKFWGKEKIFTEGTKKQVLDTLFFDFIKLAEKLKPKIIIAENVKGIISGKAKGYTIEIKKQFEKIGYKCQVFLFNSSTMGVPQTRERVFFISHKTNKNLKFNFNKKEIPFKKIRIETGTEIEKITPKFYDYWKQTAAGGGIGKFKSIKKLYENKPSLTLSTNLHYDYKIPRKLFLEELLSIGSFPIDYNFLNIKPNYVIGMSVPPIMTASIIDKVIEQLF